MIKWFPYFHSGQALGWKGLCLNLCLPFINCITVDELISLNLSFLRNWSKEVVMVRQSGPDGLSGGTCLWWIWCTPSLSHSCSDPLHLRYGLVGCMAKVRVESFMEVQKIQSPVTTSWISTAVLLTPLLPLMMTQIKHFLCPGMVAGSSESSPLYPQSSLWGRCYYCPHFKDEETKTKTVTESALPEATLWNHRARIGMQAVWLQRTEHRSLLWLVSCICRYSDSWWHAALSLCSFDHNSDQVLLPLQRRAQAWRVLKWLTWGHSAGTDPGSKSKASLWHLQFPSLWGLQIHDKTSVSLSLLTECSWWAQLMW